jgi:TP901 family phage tail tape measure protein
VAAIASGTDLEEMGRIITNVGNVTLGGAKSIEDFNRVADVLVLTANSTATNVTDLGDAMKNVGPLATDLGLEVEDTAAFMGLLANAGISGAEAGTTLRGALNRLGPALAGLQGNTDNLLPSQKRFINGLQDMGLNYEDFVNTATGEVDMGKAFDALANGLADVEDATTRSKIVVGLFGQEYGSKVLGALNQSPEAFNQLVSDLKNAGGASQNTADIMQTSISAQMAILGSAVDGVRVAIGENLEPVLRGLISSATAVFNTFATAPPLVQKLVLGTTALAGAITAAAVVSAGYQAVLKSTAVTQALVNAQDIAGSVTKGALTAVTALAAISTQKLSLAQIFEATTSKAASAAGKIKAATSLKVAAAAKAQTAATGLSGKAAAAAGLKFLALAGLMAGVVAVGIAVADTWKAVDGEAAEIRKSTQGVTEAMNAAKVAGAGVAETDFSGQLNGFQRGLDKLRGAIPGLTTAAEASAQRQAVAFSDLIGVSEENLAISQQLAASGAFSPEEGKAQVESINATIKALESQTPATQDQKVAQESLIKSLKASRDAINGKLPAEERSKELTEETTSALDALKNKQDELTQSIAARVNSGELTESEAELERAEAAEEIAERELAALEEGNADAGKLAEARVKLEEAKGNAIASERANQLSELKADETAFNAEIQSQLNSRSITEEQAGLRRAQFATKAAEKEVQVLQQTGATDQEIQEARLKVLEAKGAEREALTEQSLAKVAAAEEQALAEIREQELTGVLTTEEAELAKADAAINSAQARLAALKGAGATEKEIQDAQLDLLEAQNTKREALTEQTLAKVVAAEEQALAEIREQELTGVLTTEEAELAKADAAINSAQARLAALKETGATEKEIQDAQLDLLEAQNTKREALTAETLAKIEKLEQQRINDITALEINGAISAEQAEGAKAQAAVESAKERIAALKRVGGTEEEIQAASLELLEAQKQAEQSLIAVLESKINAQAELITGQLSAQADAIEASNRALERQSQYLSAITALEASSTALNNTRNDIAIEQAKSAEELAKQRDELLGKTKEVSEEEQKALDLAINRAEMRDRGIDPNASAVELLKERQALEDRAAAQRLAQQQQELARQHQSLEIESLLAEAAARRAVLEAKIAEAAAQQEAIKARIAEQGLRADLAAAQAAGNTDQVAQIQAQLELNKLQQEAAVLAAQNTQDAIANVELTERMNDLKRDGLINDQLAATASANQAENERRLQAARERQEAGLDRGQVELLPTQGDDILDTSKDAENKENLERIDQEILDNARQQNEASLERQSLNEVEINQQQQLLELERQRAEQLAQLATGRNGGLDNVIPGFKDGGSFSGVRTAVVGEAGPELVDFGGRRGYVYDAQKTARVLKSLPTTPMNTGLAPAVGTNSTTALLQEIKGLRREIGKAPRQLVVHQKNTANLRSLDQREVAQIVRQSHKDGIGYLERFL